MTVLDEVSAQAHTWDLAGAIPADLVERMADEGWLAAVVPADAGGLGLDEAAFGRLCFDVGGACASTRSLLTVANMVATTLMRFGTEDQRGRWIGRLPAFCLTEPRVGSDGAAVETTAVLNDSDEWVISGRKLWVTGARLAEVFLVVARCDAGPVAVLVPRATPGLSVEPVAGLGLRAALLADVALDGCRVPRDEGTVGRPGWGFTGVAATALDHGRYSIAWGCAGGASACLRAAARHASEREQFGAPLAEHQLVRRRLSDMVVGAEAARALCEEAAVRREARDPEALLRTMLAKYAATRAYAEAAASAVQVLGAEGCRPERDVERHYRDAKIMQIIEGSDEMHQLALAELALRGAAPEDR